MQIKGASTDEAVLCTSDKTYALRLAESSNNFLLAPKTAKKRPLDDALEAVADAALNPAAAENAESLRVQASAGAYFELIRSAPRTGSLLALLSAWPHGGSEAEQDAATADEAGSGETAAVKRRLSLAELETAVQSSAVELRRALQEARALEVDGGWCVLDPQLELDILECILSLCVEHEWPLSAVPTAQCVALTLSEFEFDEASIRHCMRTHSVHASDEWDTWLAAAQLETISLSPEAISRFRARALLAEADSWPKDKFYEAWGEALPAGLTPDPAHLAGLAITLPPAAGSEDEEPRLQGLPVSALSPVAKERFKALFTLKRSWTLDELTPYVNDLLDPGASATKLVLFHARSVVANDGSVSYVAR